MRESSLQNAFILAVDRCRLLSQRNRGTPLDYHYSEYSIHYNLCSQLATRIKEAVGGITSAANIQLRQQFQLQFGITEQKRRPALTTSSLYTSLNHNSEVEDELIEQLNKASEPLDLTEYGMQEAIGDDMESIISTTSDEFESIESSSTNGNSISFESIDETSDNGRSVGHSKW